MPTFTVKQARTYAGLTQKDMAVALNVHIDTYRKIENNPEDATIKQAKIISEKTGVPMDNIIFLVPNSTLSRIN